LTCANRPNGSYIPDPSRGCAAFLLCEGGIGAPNLCPYPYQFDFERQMCNYAHIVNCTLPPTHCEGRPDGFIPDPPRGCPAFQKCVDGESTLHYCDAPFYFDFENQMCNWPEYVDCT
jgi:hypothetical protein